MKSPEPVCLRAAARPKAKRQAKQQQASQGDRDMRSPQPQWSLLTAVALPPPSAQQERACQQGHPIREALLCTLS